MGKVLPTTTTAILVTAATAFAQMGDGQDGQMMGTEHGWGMGWGTGWGFGIILLIIVVIGAAYLTKRKGR
jgi:hypothetical protein